MAFSCTFGFQCKWQIAVKLFPPFFHNHLVVACWLYPPSAMASETIQVVCRLRPLNKREAGAASVLDVAEDTRSVTLRGASAQDFKYDRVFGPSSAQEDVFEAVGRPLTEACAGGFHGTVFAYGQTGSGKTHTILGAGDGEQAGLLPRVLTHLFTTISDREGKVRKSER